MGLEINIDWDSSVDSAPAAFKTGVMDAVQALESIFTNPITIVDDSTKNEAIRPGWPAFLPDSKSVVFHHQSAYDTYDTTDPNTSGQLYTRKGAKAQIAWTNLTDSSHVTALNHASSANPLISPEGLTTVAQMLADGTITARIRSTADLDAAGQVLEQLRRGGLRGKAVIRV